MRFQKYDFIVLTLFCLCGLVISGCRQKQEDFVSPEKPPKPVAITVLRQTSPTNTQFITGSVVPWKSEQIGFEVAGRVAEVIEPNEFVTPQISGQTNKQAPGATPLARLDDEELKIAVESAQASVEVAKLNRDANLVTIEQQLPAQIESARAEADLADVELSRALKLSKQNTISLSELDAARTNASTTKSRLASSNAELAQAKARQLTLEAQILQARQQLSEAQRSLRNAVLFSPFPGQVSQIHAVPGTYVKEGDPVVTVQMMDPMTIEFEVTARDSRRYRRGDMLPVQVTDGSGTSRQLSGMVYRVDTVADPAARTFTVTMHVRNEIDESAYTSPDTDEPIAWTNQITPLNIGPMITGDRRQLVVREAVHTIGGETFVWKVTNRRWGTPSPSGDRLLSVTKVPVRITSDVIPYLGRWKFVAIEFTDPNVEMDVDHDLITGKLYFKPTQPEYSVVDEVTSPKNGTSSKESLLLPRQTALLETWAGSQVMLDEQRWLLRSGDVARISLTPDEPTAGYFVPMKAVREEQGKTFVHVIDETAGQAIARRVYVEIAEGESVLGETVLLRITSTSLQELREGMQVIVEGTHYLNDGDRVVVSQLVGGQP
ncbi:putative efflux pump membrane fusion protein [Symmachiella dynata]|uniref:HlyD family secretion protein n=1 Tax=Symmachiella dynata TaxID=2527995 RepID=UPI00118A80B3|nr:HlyD family efflux transporter periplasmic adaptor subunit [Symmachiella dynata]QDT51162.1 putative efflux pump membrane fusion protein [Symmachiella dynata]